MDFVSPFKGFGLDPEDIGVTIKDMKQRKDPLRLILRDSSGFLVVMVEGEQDWNSTAG